MFFFLPIGVEDHTVDRVPWVSLGIAGISLLAFLLTWVLPGSSRQELDALQKVAHYWDAHPYLASPADRGHAELPTKLLPANRGVKQLRPTPPESEVADQQQQLDALIGDYLELSARNPLRRYGLVPARGAGQVGWITHMFLHAGWLHLLGNFLFFYLVGPLLEDVWGRPLFAIFYLVGGVLSGIGWFSADRHSAVYLVGASGAIAACMGAFTYRFARRRIVMGYFVWMFVRIFRGTFSLPAWLWGLGWFGLQVFDYKLGGDSNVAFGAHLAGFAFGFAVALLLGVTGVEAKVLAPAVARHVGWSPEPGVARAQVALAHDDLDAAERDLQQVLAAKPGDFGAALGLAQLAVRRGDGHSAGGIGKALSQVLVHSPGRAWEFVESLGPNFHPEQLSPALAFRLGMALHEAPEGVRVRRADLFAAAAAAGGALGAKALLQSAQIGLQERAEPLVVRGQLQRARAMEGLSPELIGRLTALEGQLPPEAELALPETDLPAKVLPPRLQPCRLLAVSGSDLGLIDATGKRTILPLRDIWALAVGVVRVGVAVGEPGRKVLVLDLITAAATAEAGASGRRLTSDTLVPQHFYPTLTPAQGYAALLELIARVSGAALLPDTEALRRGTYASFETFAAFETAVYGTA